MSDEAIIVLEIDTSKETPCVSSRVKRFQDEILNNLEPFVQPYADYCAKYCGLELETAKARIRAHLHADPKAALPWWTAMTIRVIGLIHDNSKVKVSFEQRQGIYLCHVYKEEEDSKFLLTSPILAAVRDRMLEVGTVQNYFRYYLAKEKEFNFEFLCRHTFVFDLTVTRENDTTLVTLKKEEEDDEKENDGIYAFEKWVFSLPPTRDRTKEAPPLLLSSEHVQHVLPDIGAAWAQIKACNVLFLAPSGSGKDVLTDFFCAGLAPELRGERASLSLAGLTAEECRLALFGASKKKGEVIGALPRAQGLNFSKHKKTEPKSGVVFVDEIHHPASEHARASLLRVMESHEYEHPVYGTVDCSDLYFVFAASCTLDELRAIQPADFWNRMDFIIEMRHPFDVGPTERVKVIKDYFNLFFSREIKSLVHRQVGDEKLGKRFAKYFDEEFRKSATPLSQASLEFAKHASYLRPGLLSVRHLRALAHVMAVNMIEFVFGRATSETKDVKSAIDKWLSEAPWRDVVFERLGEIIASR